MTDTAAPLVAAPRPAAAGEPGVRAIARRLYDAVARPADHLPARARRPADAGRRRAVPRPAALFVTPDHYVTRLLHASGVPLDALGVGRGAADRGRGPRGLAAAVLALARVPRHAGRGTGSSRSSRRSSTSPCARRRETADAIYDQIAERLGRGRLPAAGAVRAVPASRCWPPPTTRATTCPRTPRWRADPTWSGPGHPDLPAGPVPRAGRAGLGGGGRAARRGRPASTPATTPGWVRRLEARRRVLRRARRHLRRPQPRGRRHRPARSRPRPSGSTRGAGGHRHAGRGRGLPPAHAAGDGADVLRGRPGR